MLCFFLFRLLKISKIRLLSMKIKSALSFQLSLENSTSIAWLYIDCGIFQFPDRQENAIDAIFELCEDDDVNVSLVSCVARTRNVFLSHMVCMTCDFAYGMWIANDVTIHIFWISSQIRKIVIKEVPILFKQPGLHVTKLTDLLVQLLQAQDSQENHIVQVALSTVLKSHPKGIHTVKACW